MRYTYENDSLKVRVSVKSEGGANVDLTGTTLVSRFGALGVTGVTGTVDPVDLATGVVDISFPVGALKSPQGVAQLIVTKDGETKTVYSEAFEVRRSVK